MTVQAELTQDSWFESFLGGGCSEDLRRVAKVVGLRSSSGSEESPVSTAMEAAGERSE